MQGVPCNWVVQTCWHGQLAPSNPVRWATLRPRNWFGKQRFHRHDSTQVVQSRTFSSVFCATASRRLWVGVVVLWIVGAFWRQSQPSCSNTPTHQDVVLWNSELPTSTNSLELCWGGGTWLSSSLYIDDLACFDSILSSAMGGNLEGRNRTSKHSYLPVGGCCTRQNANTGQSPIETVLPSNEQE
jgi:hypothetical protein